MLSVISSRKRHASSITSSTIRSRAATMRVSLRRRSAPTARHTRQRRRFRTMCSRTAMWRGNLPRILTAGTRCCSMQSCRAGSLSRRRSEVMRRIGRLSFARGRCVTSTSSRRRRERSPRSSFVRLRRQK